MMTRRIPRHACAGYWIRGITEVGGFPIAPHTPFGQKTLKRVSLRHRGDGNYLVVGLRPTPRKDSAAMLFTFSRGHG